MKTYEFYRKYRSSIAVVTLLTLVGGSILAFQNCVVNSKVGSTDPSSPTAASTPEPSPSPGAGATPSPTPTPTASLVPAGYDLVFSDEFTQTQLDTGKWWTRVIYDGGYRTFLNQEQERYGESNNHVMTGNEMKLTAYRIDGMWERPSGMVRSKVTFKYGYFEARVKLPKEKGVWAGFWLNPDAEPDGSVTWPPELDIFEFINQGQVGDLNKIHTSAKDDGAQHADYLYTDAYYDPSDVVWTAPADLTNDYHILSGLWDTDNTFSVYMDGKLVAKRAYTWVHDDGTEAPYAHLILNLAMGGGWAGKNGVDETATKEEFIIDYIRIYQKTGQHHLGVGPIGHDLCPAAGGC